MPTYQDDDLSLLEETCAVTMFDMKVRLSKDGRVRGLWIFLEDSSDSRREAYETWLRQALDRWFKDNKTKGDAAARFRAELSLRSSASGLLKGKVSEGALLEWPAIDRFYRAMGRELIKHRVSKRLDKPARTIKKRKSTKAK